MILKLAIALALSLVIFIYVARTTQTTIHVERTLNASADKIWNLWNDPESMKKWWGPTNYTAPVIQNDLMVGGKFLLAMKSPKGELFWNTGTYQEVVQNKKIVSSLSFSDENGNVLSGKNIPVPGVWPEAVTIIVEFKEANGKTTVSIEEIGIPLIMKLFAGMGWEQQLDKFERLL